MLRSTERSIANQLLRLLYTIQAAEKEEIMSSSILTKERSDST